MPKGNNNSESTFPCLSPAISVESLRAHLTKLNLPERGIAYVLAVASSPPSRLVGGNRNRNLIFNVPIPHLGVVLQAESATGEYYFLLEKSRERDIVAIYDQPQPIFIRITNRNDVETPIQYTPDFLVIYDERVVVYEIKSDTVLADLCERRRSDWKNSDKSYQYLPAIQYYEALGIQHITLPNSAISAIRAENLRLLAAVRSVLDNHQLKQLRSRALAIVRTEQVIRLSNLLSQLEITDTTAIFQLIDSGQLSADLDETFLTATKDVWLGTSLDIVEAIKKSRPRIACALAQSCRVSTGDIADPRYLGEVAIRYAICEDGNGTSSEISISKSDRTIRRYRQAYRTSGGDIRVLFPKWERSGNRKSRKSPQHYELLHQTIREAQRDPNLSSAANAYLKYLSRLKADPTLSVEVPVTRPTLYRHWSSIRVLSEGAREQGGRRLANAAAGSLDPDNRALIPMRAFSIAHIDHYQADIALVLRVGDGRLIKQRPWITCIVDAFSGEILALWISFRSPCKESCTMAIRDCVRRHARIPELLVMDGGPDFESVHFTVMLASLSVTRTNRPPEDPRFGKEVERLFGCFKECYARGMPGFVPGASSARKVSGGYAPNDRASLALEDLMESLDAYAFEGYNHAPKPDCFESRTELRMQSEKLFPFSGIRVNWTKAFLVQTSVEAPRASYLLSASRGVRVLGRWYTNASLLSYRGFKKNVSVRIDPFDDSVVYVCIDQLWHICWSTDKLMNAGMSEIDVITKTAKHQQLRAIRNLAADEAARCAYEYKMGPIKALSDTVSTKRKPEEETKAPKKRIRSVNTRRSIDAIDDLPLDGSRHG